MKVLIASSSLVAQPTTEWLLNSDHKVVGVLTAPDAAQGRGREIAENSFALLTNPVIRERSVPRAIKADDLIKLLMAPLHSSHALDHSCK